MTTAALLGPQRPPYAWAPPAHTRRAADEAAEISARAGLALDVWQRNSLRIGMGENADGEWVATEVAELVQRQNGKGGIVEARGLYGLFVRGERKIIYTAHLDETAKNAFERAAGLVDGSSELRRRVKDIQTSNNAGRVIELQNGATWSFRTRGRTAQEGDRAGQSGGRGRGLSCDCLFMDEALYVQQEAMDAILPTMLARPNPQIWWLSTPAISPRSPLMQIRRDGLAHRDGLAMAGWWNKRGANLEDQAVLAFANPAYGIRLNAAVLRLLRNRLGEDGFARECGGLWPDEEGLEWLVISEELWEAALDPTAAIVGPLVLAVAAQHPDRSMVSITAAGRDRYGRRLVERTGRQVAGVDVPDYRPGTRWVLPRLRELVRTQSPLVVVIDDRQLADEAEAAGLPVYRPTVGDMVSACGMFKAAVADPDPMNRDLVHRGQDDLSTAVAGAGTRLVAGLWAWDRRDPAVDVTTLVSGSLALWGLSTPRIHMPSLTPFAMYGG